ncbi:TetR family transcriptional regulator [Mycolicibacterium murale]|uniref:TetR family transcriptional regulator n=1 Tax=Mycolicibacterium murale TaxID=182220 RepID=A0A7I9WQN6_9MYCO|nr:TetR/AcrR family transcriptional regulator C-terminal domain-containing protein [Mycolicibacterium murale]ANW64678.1 TetR family transcriptional regulator [Mycobacterium sp. djl-10]MCV7183218.1 TetR/AcrR family transcriptional regulator [Mycolicibacterium murale]GFG59943.1 TetR family transcriptional regulator [Mycolicibacterium murale]
MQLHKRDVIATATRILDNFGIADLTMRRLARELDVTAGALYWHFANKQELLGAVADELLRPACRCVDGLGWRERIATVCTRLRDALLSHTDGAELVSASFASGQSAAMPLVVGLLTAAARDAGVPEAEAELAARTIIYYTLGFTVDEQSRLQLDSAGALPTGGPAFDRPDTFGFGLALLIDGMAVRATS